MSIHDMFNALNESEGDAGVDLRTLSQKVGWWSKVRGTSIDRGVSYLLNADPYFEIRLNIDSKSNRLGYDFNLELFAKGQRDSIARVGVGSHEITERNLDAFYSVLGDAGMIADDMRSAAVDAERVLGSNQWILTDMALNRYNARRYPKFADALGEIGAAFGNLVDALKSGLRYI